jgi:serine protease Do
MNYRKILASMLPALVGGLLALFAYKAFFDKPATSSTMQVQVPARWASLPYGLDSNQFDFTYAAEVTVNSVVHVKTKSMRENQSMTGNPFFDYFFGYPNRPQQPEPVMGFGSGVIISGNGYIITNNHVIDKAKEIEVVLNDKRTYEAKLIGADPSTDLALLKIEGEDFPFIPYGDSDALKIGEWVLAVGNPYNLTSTVTAGIVSAKARNINILRDQFAIESFIQTDAAVNPGNSGGALVNTRGELMGINTAIASRTGAYSGNSFAIPTSIARKVIGDLIEFGEVQRAILGVTIQELSSQLAKEKKIDRIEGVYVNGTRPDGAAAEAGIKEGDVILAINGNRVNSPSELQEQVSRYRPNDKVNVDVNRNGKRKQIEVTLRNMKGGTEMIARQNILSILGAEMRDAPDQEKSKLGISGGAQVTKLAAGKLRSAGIQEGFIITQINNQEVLTVEDVNKIIGEIKGGVYIQGVYPNGTVAYYAFGM